MMSFLLLVKKLWLYLQYQTYYYTFYDWGTGLKARMTLHLHVHLWWCNSSYRCAPVRFGFSGHFCPRNYPSLSSTQFCVIPAKIGPPSPEY